MRHAVILVTIGILAGCGEDQNTSEVDPSAQTVEVPEPVLPSAPPPTDIAPASELSSDDKGRVCRAAIASLNGRDPAIIRVIQSDGDLYRVRYTRDDGTVWTNECRVGETTAEWRIVENGQPGRWRTEDTIRFSVDGSTVQIATFMGSEPMTADTYELH